MSSESEYVERLSREMRVPKSVVGKALEGAKPVIRELERETKRFVPTKGRFGNDRYGTPIQYDPKHKGPIMSEVRPNAGWSSSEEVEKWPTEIMCSKCEKFTTRVKAEWAEHRRTSCPNALFHFPAVRKGVKCKGPAVIAKNTSRAPTKSDAIDPFGRTIYGTPEQLRIEAERHDAYIKEGPGAD